MSLHDQLMAAQGSPVLMERLGARGRVGYAAPGSAVVAPLSAIVGRIEGIDQSNEGTGRERLLSRDVTVPTRELTALGLVGLPCQGVVHVDGVPWEIETSQSRDGITWTRLRLSRTELIEQPRPRQNGSL